MKNTYRALLLIALISGVISCGNEEAKEKESENTEKEETQQDGPVKQEETLVELNNGKKWKANPETTTGIENMATIIVGYSESKTIDSLHTKLNHEFRTIFKNCTMKGEAHNQLHAFLIPISKYLEQLKECTECLEIIDDLEAHLNTYSDYFE